MVIVTAYYPLAKSKHSQQQYIEWIKLFFKSVSCDIICFCPREMEKPMNTLKNKNTRIILREFNSLKMMSTSWLKIWRDFNKTDPELYHSPELYAIWAAKQEFVLEAAQIVKSDVYVWCDIGCFRKIRDGNFLQTKLYVSPRQITCLSIEDTIGGGVLAGDIDAWNLFSKLYIDELSRNPHGKDQVIYKRILNKNNATIIESSKIFGDPWFYLTHLFSFDSFNFIQKVVYINLEHRTDRRDHIEHELLIFPSDKILRFNAIMDKNGAIGCTKSHIEVLKLAIKNDWDNILIVEDDMKWSQFQTGIQQVRNLSKLKYDVIVLGGTNITQVDGKLKECQTTTAYIVSNHYYKKLLDNFEEGLELFISTKIASNYAIDQYWKKLQAIDNWYIVTPNISVQIPGYSDIEGSDVNYLNMFGMNTLPSQKRILDQLFGRK